MSTVTAIPFIEIVRNTDDTANVYSVNPAAKDFLDKLRSPAGIGCICIGGNYRVGKSTFLNLLAQTPAGQGFGVGNTQRPKTFGLWLLTKTLTCTDSKGRTFESIILDCEGLSAVDANEDHDIKLFALGILLSSLFIFNIKNIIDHDAMTLLAKVLDLTKLVRVSDNNTAGDGGNDDVDKKQQQELASIMPNFLWLLRDFSLDLRHADNRAMNSTEYLETVLCSDATVNNTENEMRRQIRTLLPRRFCSTLPRPANEESIVQNMAVASTQQLRKPFVEQMARLRVQICDTNAAVKTTLTGQPVNGPILARLAELLVASFNSQSVPVLANSWQQMSDLYCNQAIDKAAIEWQQQVKTLDDDPRRYHSSSSLKAVLTEARLRAQRVYSESAVGLEKEPRWKRFELFLCQKEAEWEQKNSKRLEERLESAADPDWSVHSKYKLVEIKSKVVQWRASLESEYAREEPSIRVQVQHGLDHLVCKRLWLWLEQHLAVCDTEGELRLQALTEANQQLVVELQASRCRETVSVEAFSGQALRLLAVEQQLLAAETALELLQNEQQRASAESTEELSILRQRCETEKQRGVEAEAELVQLQGQVEEQQIQLFRRQHECDAAEKQVEQLLKEGILRKRDASLAAEEQQELLAKIELEREQEKQSLSRERQQFKESTLVSEAVAEAARLQVRMVQERLDSTQTRLEKQTVTYQQELQNYCDQLRRKEEERQDLLKKRVEEQLAQKRESRDALEKLVQESQLQRDKKRSAEWETEECERRQLRTQLQEQRKDFIRANCEKDLYLGLWNKQLEEKEVLSARIKELERK